jgi:hypothetical protein
VNGLKDWMIPVSNYSELNPSVGEEMNFDAASVCVRIVSNYSELNPSVGDVVMVVKWFIKDTWFPTIPN